MVEEVGLCVRLSWLCAFHELLSRLIRKCFLIFFFVAIVHCDMNIVNCDILFAAKINVKCIVKMNVFLPALLFAYIRRKTGGNVALNGVSMVLQASREF